MEASSLSIYFQNFPNCNKTASEDLAYNQRTGNSVNYKLKVPRLKTDFGKVSKYNPLSQMAAF